MEYTKLVGFPYVTDFIDNSRKRRLSYLPCFFKLSQRITQKMKKSQTDIGMTTQFNFTIRSEQRSSTNTFAIERIGHKPTEVNLVPVVISCKLFIIFF